jgi:hypothetical protein
MAIPFITMTEQGPVGPVQYVHPEKCPHFIMVPEHFRPNATCRCDDKSHVEMREWGYRWRNGAWRSSK